MLRHWIVAITLALGACASTPPLEGQAALEGRDCFRNDDIDGFGVIDSRTLRVDTGPSRHYALTLLSNAREIEFEDEIWLRSRPSQWICAGEANDVTVYAGRRMVRSWPVTRVARLPDDAQRAAASGE